jgi:hypothetical protein
VETSGDKPDITKIFQKAVNNPVLLDPVERDIFIKRSNARNIRIHQFVEFPVPFDRFFAYGWILLNLKNPIVQKLIQTIAAVELCKIQRTLPADKIGYLEDLLESIGDEYWNAFNMEKSIKILNTILCSANEMKLIDLGNFEDMILTDEDFVPGSVRYHLNSHDRSSRDDKEIKPFGMTI